MESFEKCARVALNLDSAIWRANASQLQGFFREGSCPFRQRWTSTMDLENAKGGKRHKIAALREQRRKDIERGACFRCNKVGCKPW